MTDRVRIRVQGTALVDFESRSRCNLRKRGGRNYWADPSTEAICAVVYDVDADRWHTWQPGDPAPRIGTAVAHNAMTFDRHAAAACGWRVDAWLDSSHLSQRAGLPGALAALGRDDPDSLQKDKEGSKLTLSMSRVSRARATRGQLPTITPEVRKRITQYCRIDVELMAEHWPWLESWVDVDADVVAADTAVNDRGVGLDRDLVLALQREVARLQDVAVREAAQRWGKSEKRTRAAARSPQQFVKATGLPNAQAATVEDAIASARARRREPHPLIAARAALASIVPGKLVAALNFASADDRVRDSHKYYGAHTGRWSSKGIQLHNLVRASFEELAKSLGLDPGDVVRAAVAHVCAGRALTGDDVDALLRSILVAAPGRKLSVFDYRGIEARMAAWAAGDTAALEVFAAFDAGKGANPYIVMAERIFGRGVSKGTPEYTVGKQAELGCQYGMGADKFAATCLKAGVDLDAVGVDAGEVVRAWRDLHRPIVQLWYACERAFAAACAGRVAWAGPWRYEPIGSDDVACFLPSGRPIVYPHAECRAGARGRKLLSFIGRKGFRQSVYGGLLVENADQASCRDLLADALVQCEDIGLNPVLHVHDELVCEIDDDAAEDGHAEHRRIQSDAPEWANGLPVQVDGFLDERYRK